MFKSLNFANLIIGALIVVFVQQVLKNFHFSNTTSYLISFFVGLVLILLEDFIGFYNKNKDKI